MSTENLTGSTAGASSNIAEVTTECRDLLRRCAEIRCLGHNDWAENRFADFVLWDAGLGASSIRRASLEERLALKPHLKTVVMNVLCVYKISLELCVELGRKHERQKDGLTESPLTKDYQISKPKRWYRGLPHKPTISHTTMDLPLLDALTNADTVLNDLARIAALLRKAGSSSRHHKADKTFRPKDPRFDKLRSHLVQIILCQPGTLEARRIRYWDMADAELGDLYGGTGQVNRDSMDAQTICDVENSASLTVIQKRLLRANLRRLHRFTYSQRHALKLRYAAVSPLDSPDPACTGTTSESKPEISSETSSKRRVADADQKDERAIQAVDVDAASKVLSDTTASAIATAIIRNLEKQPTPSQQAVTEITTTGSRLRYPRPPKIRPQATVFECPCCCATLPILFAEARRWRKHIKEDIVPYICVLRDCPCPEVLYAERSTWEAHMRDDHDTIVYWQCILCDDLKKYQSQSQLTEHLSSEHDGAMPDFQNELLLEMCAKQQTLSSCPLCFWSEDNEGQIDDQALLEHVAEHIHSFALRSLPWAPDKSEENNAALVNSWEKVEKWFDGRFPEEQGSGYVPLLEPNSQLETTKDYFQEHEYFAEHSGLSSLNSSRSTMDDMSWISSVYKSSVYSDIASQAVSDEDAQDAGQIRRPPLQRRNAFTGAYDTFQPLVKDNQPTSRLDNFSKRIRRLFGS